MPLSTAARIRLAFQPDQLAVEAVKLLHQLFDTLVVVEAHLLHQLDHFKLYRVVFACWQAR